MKSASRPPKKGLEDADGFPICWRCGCQDFGPCCDGTLLCNGCDAEWQESPRTNGVVIELPLSVVRDLFPDMEVPSADPQEDR